MSEAPAREAPGLAAARGVLERVFGYPSFRGLQAPIVEHVVAGGDALVLMPTGGGQVAVLPGPGAGARRRRRGRVAADRPDAGPGRRAARERRARRLPELHAGAAEARAVEQAVRTGALDLLYVAPERLLTERCLALLHESRLALFAIDEAHCVSQWGHDFRPEYLGLSVLHEQFPDVPRIALTATADPQTRHEIRRAAGAGRGARVRRELRPAEHPLRDRREERTAHDSCWRCCASEPAGSAGIVYCASRRKVDETAAWLRQARVRRARLPRRHGRRRAQRQPVAVPARGRRRDGGDHRLRHGHRQARRALRRAPGHAQERRGLLPGDRPRRPRRPAGAGLDGLRAGRRRAEPSADRRVRGRRRAQARVAGQARRDGCAGRDRRLPARAAAAVLRRAEPGRAATATTA